MESKQTVKEMATFILATVDLLDTYDLSKSYNKAIRARVKEKYGVYMDDGDIRDVLSFDDNWKNFFDKKIAPKYKDLETFKFFQEVDFVGRKIWKIEGDTIVASDMSVDSLIYLMFYVVKNELDLDMARANKVKDASGLPYNIAKFDFTNFGEFGDVTVKRFVNGKITFKGLNDEQRARLEKVYEITHRN